MTRSRRFWAWRLRAALVVIGLTLGILLLFFLQFALPYYIGPVGLVAVVLLDVGIYLETHRRRAIRRRRLARYRLTSGPAGRPRVAHVRRAFDDEYVVAVALVVFVIGLIIEGAELQVPSWSGSNWILFEVGGAITLVASLMLWPYEWRFYDWRTESEKFDTTEDH